MVIYTTVYDKKPMFCNVNKVFRTTIRKTIVEARRQSSKIQQRLIKSYPRMHLKKDILILNSLDSIIKRNKEIYKHNGNCWIDKRRSKSLSLCLHFFGCIFLTSEKYLYALNLTLMTDHCGLFTQTRQDYSRNFMCISHRWNINCLVMTNWYNVFQ